MAVLDPKDIEARRGSLYPHPYTKELQGRLKKSLTDRLGLSQFGVNVVTLEPGAWSSQRHWHAKEDEFIYVLEGNITLVTNEGEQVLYPGVSAGFPAGVQDAHHLVNKTCEPVKYLEVGTRTSDDKVEYSDVDMKAHKVDGQWIFTRKNGEPYG